MSNILNDYNNFNNKNYRRELKLYLIHSTIRCNEKWAKDEINKRYQKDNDSDDYTAYNTLISKNVLKAFSSIFEDRYSSIYDKETIIYLLNRLCNYLPLTPIKNTDNIWIKHLTYNIPDVSLKEVYQCSRMPSLFKEVYSDGSIKYKDITRYHVKFKGNARLIYDYCEIIDRVMDELYPITFPYFPTKDPYYIYPEICCQNLDIMVIRYIVTPTKELVEINRYFKKEGDTDYIEITEDEYNKLKHMDIKEEESDE